MAERSNRLAHETSPYLLEHASQPVDWYAWGAEALERAEREDKPILLSIGYSACHWCHVMARESFEDAEIARLMNEHFVCIKVDREERPDLDELYMTATVALSGSGGWPMTVFLTPSREPFFAGTYFPPRDAQGRPGMVTVLGRVAELWRDERGTLFEQARELTEHLKKRAELPQTAGVSAEALRVAARQLAREFDPVFGGFGRAPKFPASAALSLLLRHARRSGDSEALGMVNHTLGAMAAGGIYDQLGGGFARYSVDAGWVVPHFEKMLYDNAQLVEVYLEAYQEGGQDTFRRVARETLDYMIQEMQSPAGGFFSSSDADSEGQEGKYFVFSAEELRRILGQPLATRFGAYYGVSEAGNFEGKNVLTLARSLDQVASELGVAAAELAEDVERGRALLLEHRRTRVAPAVDDKVLSSWNGLAIRALAEGARVLGDVRYLEAAERAARFLLQTQRDADGRLLRVSRSGQARLGGYLEDYAFVADGLLSLYEAGGHDDFFRESVELTERMLADFEAEDGGALHHTSRHHEALLARPREGSDGAVPSPNAVAARVLARLAAHGVHAERYRARASNIVRAFGAPLKRAPRAFASLLGVVDFLLGPTLEVAIAHGDEAEAGRLVSELSHRYLPNRVLAHAEAGVCASPLGQGKVAQDGQTTAYVCESFVCRAPTSDPVALAELLGEYVARSTKEGLGELGAARQAGRATPEGTARWFARGKRSESAHPGRTSFQFEGLTLSKLVLGSYRVGLDHPAHREAVELALRQGANVVDTSPSFARGDSERLIGEILSSFSESGGPAREEFVIVSKVGVALGAEAERLARRSEEGAVPAFTVPLRADQPLEQGAFSLDDEFLEAQLRGSLERLGLEHLDVCLLQSPEHLLLAGLDRATFEAALVSAFAFLERQVTLGRIGRYGLVTNTATLFGEKEQVDVLRALELAKEAHGPSHHFRVVELPINLAERAALGPAERAALEGSAGESWLELVRGQGVLTLACRPLSTFAPGALLRLVDPPTARPTTPLAEARYRLASLEAEFETRFGPALRLAGLVGPEALLDLSTKLGPVLERTATVEQFDQAETTLVTPRLRGTLSELDRAHAGDEQAKWSEFRGNYVRAVAGYLEAVRARASEQSAASLASLAQSVTGDPGVPAPVRAWLDEAQGAPWLDKALGALWRTPGLDAVAVGLRTPQQVQAALGVLGRL